MKKYRPRSFSRFSPRSLVARCFESFEQGTRSRGNEYFLRGLVSNPNYRGDQSIALVVRGGLSYQVDVDWSSAGDAATIYMECTCPHYRDGFLCKHCWASLQQLDKDSIGYIIPGSHAIQVVHESDMEMDDGGAEMAELPENTRADHSRQSSTQSTFWQSQLAHIQAKTLAATESIGPKPSLFKRSRLAHYELDLVRTRSRAGICINFYHEEILTNQETKIVKSHQLSRNDLHLYSDPLDREVMSMLLTKYHTYSDPFQSGPYYGQYSAPDTSETEISTELQVDILQRLCRTGRFFMPPDAHSVPSLPKMPLSFDDGEAWHLGLEISPREDEYYVIKGELLRGETRIGLDEPKLLLSSGIVIFPDHIAKLNAKAHFAWISALRGDGFAPIPFSDSEHLILALHADPNVPYVRWPENLRWPQQSIVPTPNVVFGPVGGERAGRGLLAELRFNYDEHEINADLANASVPDPLKRRIIARDLKTEDSLLNYLQSMPCLEGLSTRGKFRLQSDQFPTVAQTLLDRGWKIEALGKKVLRPSRLDVEISSGLDWFDLKGRSHFEGGTEMSLPALLSALERGESLVPLDDGTLGMLPLDWLKKYGPLSSLGKTKGDDIRFQRAQGIFMSAWLEEDTNVRSDAVFQTLIKTLRAKNTIKPRQPAKSFKGQLRDYQLEGLTWLSFLKNSGLGGILADDMGLGKTVQVLAHLNSEYATRKKGHHRPSLIIVPKSLMFNWQQEAANFTPRLKVLCYAGTERKVHLDKINDYDLVVITYATLRQDIDAFQSIDFHYVIADEAQAIKNSTSQAYAACMLVRGRHRLAMTGTPVENSIEDLFAIVNFSCPGLLGKNAQDKIGRASAHGRLDSETLGQFSKALAPFILRRTKEQVLTELPKKMEQVLSCELNALDTRRYNELRDYYQKHLKSEIAQKGVARSKIVVLEALLRLRQAACHPGLIDKKRLNYVSSKIEMLIIHLRDVIRGGHKALVFSQFTGLLDIVERSLKKEKMTYVRLDGKSTTQARRDNVVRFQDEKDLNVFLISLKAGGVGLNLTAADYVFILDPWWNPATESQAIDRSHRIGQKSKVTAYRLIAKGTVEEKILALQASKRELASALISSDVSLVKTLTSEDIEVLFS